MLSVYLSMALATCYAADDHLITDRLPIAQRGVASYLRSCPAAEHLEDDLTGESRLALVEVLRAKPDATDDYVFVAVKNRLKRFAAEFDSPASQRTQRRRKGKEHVPREVQTELPDRAELDGVQDVLDRLDAACQDETDREICRLRAEGYKDREVGEKLGLSASAVGERRRAIEARYDEIVSM